MPAGFNNLNVEMAETEEEAEEGIEATLGNDI